jgi:hypothetical protein
MNKELQKIISRLKMQIDSVTEKILRYPESELQRKPSQAKWSKKEILGHLIDSAANNHHRFIKSQFLPSPFFVDGYGQNEWVQVQNYNKKDTNELVNLWKVYNEHIIHVMKNTPDENLRIELKAEDPFENADNLFMLMKDYVDHLDHHLNKIFNE